MKPTRLTLLGLICTAVFTLNACDWLPDDNDLFGGGSDEPTLPGERISIILDKHSLEIDSALADSMVELPSAAANEEWTAHAGVEQMHMGNLALRDAIDDSANVSIGEGAGYEGRRVISPVIGGGKLYAMDGEGYISAHDAANVSDRVWLSPGTSTDNSNNILSGGLAYKNGMLFATSGLGRVAAFSAESGAELWRQELLIPLRAAPRVSDDTVYVVTIDSQLYALDPKTGAIRWTHRGVDEGSGYMVDATPALGYSTVIAPYGSGEVQVLRSEDGSELWSDAVYGPSRRSASSVFAGIGADPVVQDGMLYVPGSAGLFASIQADNGRRLWEQPISSVNVPWVAGDYAYVLSSDSQIIALHRRDGRVRWISQLPEFEDDDDRLMRYSWHGPVMAGGRLLIIGAHGLLVELNPADGSEMALRDIPSGVYASPVVANNTLYMVDEDATLHAWR